MKRSRAMTDEGDYIQYDPAKCMNYRQDSSNLREFSALDDAEEFVREMNPENMLRRIENLEEQIVQMKKENIENANQIESLKKLLYKCP